MIGPKAPNTKRGRDEDNAYTMTPCTPHMVAISGYVKRMPAPSPTVNALCQLLLERKVKGIEGDEAAARSSRKYYLDRVHTVLLSFV